VGVADVDTATAPDLRKTHTDRFVFMSATANNIFNLRVLVSE
jgi:hypothetical protein